MDADDPIIEARSADMPHNPRAVYECLYCGAPMNDYASRFCGPDCDREYHTVRYDGSAPPQDAGAGEVEKCPECGSGALRPLGQHPTWRQCEVCFCTSKNCSGETEAFLRRLAEKINDDPRQLGGCQASALDDAADHVAQLTRERDAANAWAREASTEEREIREQLTRELEQTRVQLAGCSVAALGYATGDQDAKPGDYGYSASFADVKQLYEKYARSGRAREELQKDKERLDWLEQNPYGAQWTVGYLGYPSGWCATVPFSKLGTLRSAIDIAMAPSTPGEEKAG